MDINLTLHLLSGNLAGESTVADDNLPWITKTHWPMPSPPTSLPFTASKCFAIVRNPIDVMPSLALLMNTSSHSLTVNPPVNEADPAWWDRFTEQLTRVQEEAYEVMRAQNESQVPTYYVRYEDMVLNP